MKKLTKTQVSCIVLAGVYDGEYVERMSFLFDCRCFFSTIGKVLKREGVVEGGTGRSRQAEKEAEMSVK